MQKTGQTNLSSFLVLSGLKKGFHFRCLQPFSGVLAIFQHGDERPNKQLGDPSASQLLTIATAVFCKKCYI